jgi:3-oxoacyl-[acyl-carrier-protein] synthase II
MSIVIRGSACLGGFGNSVDDLLRGLEKSPSVDHEDVRVAKVDISLLKNYLPPRSLRQMDDFTKMSVLCAFQALEAAGIDPLGVHRDEQHRFGIILASGYGPASPTFAFLDSILQHGELMSSPLAFSRSVHNIPAATLSMLLGWSGPCSTVCQTDCPVSAGLLLADDWLWERKVDMVLFGAADETTPLLASVSKRLAARNAARFPTVEQRRSCLPLGEGAAFFCCEPAAGGLSASSPTITRIAVQARTLPDKGRFPHADFVLPRSLPLSVSGRVPSQMLDCAMVHCAEHAYGNIPVAQAMDMALAVRTLGNGAEAWGCLAYGEHFSGYVQLEIARPAP